MKKIKPSLFFSVLFILIIIFNIYFLRDVTCTKLGDLILDKLLGFNLDCYERKNKGVIYPRIKFLGPRFNLIEKKKLVNCPENSPIIILTGQSNSANFLKSKHIYNNIHVNFFNDNCYNLSSPVLGAEGEMSSLAPAIAHKINTDKKFIFITSGRGGISIEDASISNQDFITYNIKALNFLKKKNNYLKYFIWIHGEANNGKTQNYYNDFIKIYNTISKLEQNQKINLIITQTSLCKNEFDPVLNLIQIELSYKFNYFNDIIKTDDLNGDYRYDDCHFNELGLEEIASRISKLINKLENE